MLVSDVDLTHATDFKCPKGILLLVEGLQIPSLRAKKQFIRLADAFLQSLFTDIVKGDHVVC